MSTLRVTLIDVGWGDSIFLETRDKNGPRHYGLIDSNDSATLRSSYIFLQRFFEKEYAKQNLPLPDPKKNPLFDWVLLTHAHSDHAQGLKRLLQEFGTERFWYPNTVMFQAQQPGAKPGKPVYIGSLFRFIKRSAAVRRYVAVESGKQLAIISSEVFH